MNSIEPYPFRFSISEYSRKERFDAWRAEHKHHDISWRMRDVDIHDARFRGMHLDGMMLGQWHFNGSFVKPVDRFACRSPAKIRGDMLDHYYLRLSLSDSWIFRANDRPVMIHAGQLTLIDLGQPYDLSIAAGDVLMLMVPRHFLPVATAELHGAVLDHALGKMFGDHLKTLFNRANELAASEFASITGATTDFLKATLSADPDRVSHVERQIDTTMLNRARWHIDRHIEDADLNVNVLCVNLGLSRSRLYRLFEPIGGVANYIREQRLSTIRGLLQARIGPRPLIADLSFRYGFSSPVQMTRAFKRTYGYTPSEAAAVSPEINDICPSDGTGMWLMPR